MNQSFVWTKKKKKKRSLREGSFTVKAKFYWVESRLFTMFFFFKQFFSGIQVETSAKKDQLVVNCFRMQLFSLIINIIIA